MAKPISNPSLPLALAKMAQATHSQIDETAGNLFFGRMTRKYGLQPTKHAFKSICDGDVALTEKMSSAFHSVKGEPDVKNYLNFLNVLKSTMEPFLHASAVLALGVAAMKECPEFEEVTHREFPVEDALQRAAQMRKLMEENQDLLRSVKTLDLSCEGLRFLPPEIRYFSALESLDISNNSLQALPQAIFQLRHLKRLLAGSNTLKELPAAIGELKALETLVLQNNLLEEIPAHIGELSELKLLNLAYNCLGELPEEICECRLLIYLYLDVNELLELPRGIDRLKSLRGLFLYGNGLRSLPQGLFKLKELYTLAISCNPLESLPPEIGNLTNLRHLTVCNAYLTSLPPEIGRLVHLIQLSIDSNSIKELPVEMSALTKLKHFSFFNNPLHAIPSALSAFPFWSEDDQLYPRVEMVDRPVLNKALLQEDFAQVYWRLKENKWKEAIDGIHHPHGKDVYDQGLHDPKKKEPGYLASMEQAFALLTAYSNKILDADFYLYLHQKACAHFDGQKMAGAFRVRTRQVHAAMDGEYKLDRRAIEELENLNQKVSQRFGPSFSLCEMTTLKGHPDGVKLNYTRLNPEQVRILFHFFVTEFYYEIGHAKSADEKRRAIARWFQANEWLHPPIDGCGRTDVAMLNYLLTCYGFHPALLQLPYVSSVQTLEQWDKALKEGIEAWKKEAQ